MNSYEWAQEYLAGAGIGLDAPSEIIQNTPWSCVTRLTTSEASFDPKRGFDTSMGARTNFMDYL
jgi:hypothetical protein